MDNKKPKTISLIITGVALAAIVILLIFAKKQQAANSNTQQQAAATAATPVSICYVLNKPAASSSYHDAGYLKITTSDGGKTITGELGTRPAEKDAVSGTITGTIAEDNGAALFTGTYAAMGEGMKSVQDQLIRLDETQAQIGFGEQVENKDGSYSYKDKTKVTYSYALPAVDCAQYDTLKATAWKQ